MDTKYFITSDSTTDIPENLCENGYDTIKMTYVLDGVLYDGETNDFLSPEAFYEQLRAGAIVSTSLVPEHTALEFFESKLKAGYDVLHIGFSSGLSGTYDNYVKAKEKLEKKYPERKIALIDSKSASGGEGLLVLKAIRNRKKGMDIASNALDVEAAVDNVIHLFTVDDLMHLYRGGRLSKSKAIMGTLAHIKPVLIVNKEGKLEQFMKVSGNNLCIKTIAENLAHRVKGFDNDVCFITHTMALNNAEKLKAKIQELTGVNDVRIMPCSPIIGAHLGYGAVTVEMFGSPKNPK